MFAPPPGFLIICGSFPYPANSQSSSHKLYADIREPYGFLVRPDIPHKAF